MNGPPRYLTQIRTYWYYEREIPGKLRPYFRWDGQPVTRRLRIKTGCESLAEATVKYAKIHLMVESAIAAAAGKIPVVIPDQTDQEITATILSVMTKTTVRITDDEAFILHVEKELKGNLSEPLKVRYRDLIIPTFFSSLDRPSSGPVITVLAPPDNGLSLQQVIDRYYKTNAHVKSLLPNTKAAFDAFKELVGKDTPIRAINRTHCREFQEQLVEEDYKPSTINSKIGKIATLFTWAVKETIANTHPALGLNVPHDGSEKTGFTDEELAILFPKTYSFEPRNWLPLIMLFQGCRPNEAAQLQMPDIIDDHDIPHIFFVRNIVENGLLTKKPHPMKSIKEKCSDRWNPIHPSLIKLGFLDYVKSRKGKDQLFDIGRRYDNHWHTVQEHYNNEFLKPVKTADKTMHGFRHTWKRASQTIRGENAKHISELGGWSKGSGAEETVYGKFTDLDILLPIVSQVEYNVPLFKG